MFIRFKEENLKKQSLSLKLLRYLEPEESRTGIARQKFIFCSKTVVFFTFGPIRKSNSACHTQSVSLDYFPAFRIICLS